ncbi:MAG TPA: DUF192 domain-containing protein [Acidimicrobiales bacterium]|jgi:hypothetical protein
MRSGWLLRDGQVLASVDIADSPVERMRGLLGRSSYEGAMLLPATRSVHTLMMRFPLDVAHMTADLKVLSTSRMGRWRIGLPRPGCRCVLEASSGAFERWALEVGDQLEIRDAR